MQATPYTDINRQLDELLSRMQAILGKKLIGLYLFGSLVWGDFDYAISDIDLLAAIAADLDDQEFVQLDRLHHDLAKAYPEWEGRLEIAYISTQALQTFKTRTSPIAIISPGEPFHVKEAGNDWLINWYIVQEKGLTLYGPAPTSIIAPISKEEFIQWVRVQAEEWREYIIHALHSRPYQAYSILTMCRALYASRTGRQVSKKQAALWTQQHFPEWAAQIEKALKWREDHRNKQIDHEATYPETVRFVTAVIDYIKTENRPA
jgi:predicted nucleotidyltransferase